MTTRLWIADDHLVVRRGLGQLVANCRDMRVIGESKDGQETLAAADHHKIDLMLLDLSMPDGGIALIEQLSTRKPNMPVLVLTMHCDAQLAHRAIKAGASGYATKDAGADDLLSAIRKVAAGGHFMDPLIADVLLFERETIEEPDPEVLSPRERAILDRLADGLSLVEIAAEFGRSAKTVSVQKHTLMRKLKLTTNAELFQYAIRHNIGQH
jgi:DNA-binding NarL/FixJ family response regulator